MCFTCPGRANNVRVTITNVTRRYTTDDTKNGVKTFAFDCVNCSQLITTETPCRRSTVAVRKPEDRHFTRFVFFPRRFYTFQIKYTFGSFRTIVYPRPPHPIFIVHRTADTICLFFVVIFSFFR